MKKLKRRALAILLASGSLAWLGIRWGNSRTTPLSLLGPQRDQLSDCPDSPNCVSTTALRPENHIEPIEFSETANAAKQKLESIIREMPGSRIITAERLYIHAEYRSRVFGFVDDVEVLLDEAQKLIFLRSSSRIGYSDLGVNRKRTDQIRRLFAKP